METAIPGRPVPCLESRWTLALRRKMKEGGLNVGKVLPCDGHGWIVFVQKCVSNRIALNMFSIAIDFVSMVGMEW